MGTLKSDDFSKFPLLHPATEREEQVRLVTHDPLGEELCPGAVRCRREAVERWVQEGNLRFGGRLFFVCFGDAAAA